jgi:hypothetical protein
LEARVDEVLRENRNLTAREIAETLSCSRTSLYRLAAFRRIRDKQNAERAERRAAFRSSSPRGLKTKDDSYEDVTSIECWDQNQKTPLQILIDQ